MGAATTSRARRRRLLWLVGAVSVGGTAVAGTFTGAGSPTAAAIGVLVALCTGGWALWRAAPDLQQARSNLARGLLVSIVVAAAIGGAQLAIDDSQGQTELKRHVAAQNVAGRQDARLTVGLQKGLVGIELSNRDLRRFYFARKNLEEATFEQATLFEANLERANLRNAEFPRADLRHASLFEAKLQGANLRGADLGHALVNGARLSLADLTGAHLRGAKLRDVSLRWAFLVGADLHGADLRDADIRGADLRGADLRGTNLRGANLGGAIADSRTRWPRAVTGVAPELASCARGQRPPVAHGRMGFQSVAWTPSQRTLALKFDGRWAASEHRR